MTADKDITYIEPQRELLRLMEVAARCNEALPKWIAGRCAKERGHAGACGPKPKLGPSNRVEST